MKRLLVCCGLLGVMAVGGLAFSAPQANFAGTWVLDKAKSEGLPQAMQNADNVTLTVTQDGKQVTVEQPGRQGAGPMKVVYNLDGSETTTDVTGRLTGKATRKAKWMDGGKMLELHEAVSGKIQDMDVTRTTIEHWELAEGGKVLKVHRTVEDPRGKREIKMTFNKQ